MYTHNTIQYNVKLVVLYFLTSFIISCSSDDGSDSYDINNLNDFNSLPVIWLETKNGAQILDKENYLQMTFSLIDSNNYTNNTSILTGGIRGRGNSTWTLPKKPYRIKLDKKSSLFGLEAARNWILLAEYIDPTLINNAVAFELGKNVFELPYTHSYFHVHLFLNGEYQGVYGLTEHNEVGKGRVDIDENEGWFINIDVLYDEDPKFRTKNYDLPIIVESPEFGIDFVKNDINELCDSLASKSFPENGYRDLIDMDTFIDFLMVNEIVLNYELLHPKSAYMYKDKGGKISMGTLWDFDWTFYLSEGNTVFNSTDNYINKNIYHDFFKRFFEDPIFEEKYKERWNEKYMEILAVESFIDSLGTVLEQPAVENFKIWNPTNNYSEQIQKMKEWWKNRVNWLNMKINKKSALR